MKFREHVRQALIGDEGELDNWTTIAKELGVTSVQMKDEK